MANEKSFQLLDLVYERLQNESMKVELLDRIIHFVGKSYYAADFFLSKLQDYTALANAKERAFEKGWVDIFLLMFASSNSYEMAKKTSAILVNFNGQFTAMQIENIISAALSNDQITNSWGAQENLEKILILYRSQISSEEKEDIKKALRIVL
ncbi:MAG TPA: hypothetical protein VK487_00700 [Candidatus Bathyarchaeia archaeon]|nr:hypothetical protein [Candidatus Bathyarchaeia archaeon]